ncbi:hypothetical protein ABZ896_22995 [Streptomyces sp. NPDC047072]|uniref:hypothetical protein n=1 Tax=Streptomyces sp. NPDC047072 TaxID=3154809 RepID=UPI0033C1E8BE
MTYLVTSHGRVTSVHTTLRSARAAEAQGPGPSDEAGPLLNGQPAWWYRGGRDDSSQLGIVRTEATALGIRFELRACQAPAGSCDHHPCTAYATWAVSSSYDLLSGLASFVPSSWVWAGMRSPDPRGDDPGFRADARALLDRLAADLRPPLRSVGTAPVDPRTLAERRTAAYGLVVRFLADRFGPTATASATVEVRTVLVGACLHLMFHPPVEARRALCGAWVADQGQDGGSAADEDGVRQCEQCFGRAPITPLPVFTAAEHDAWTAYLDSQNPSRP